MKTPGVTVLRAAVPADVQARWDAMTPDDRAKYKAIWDQWEGALYACFGITRVGRK